MDIASYQRPASGCLEMLPYAVASGWKRRNDLDGHKRPGTTKACSVDRVVGLWLFINYTAIIKRPLTLPNEKIHV